MAPDASQTQVPPTAEYEPSSNNTHGKAVTPAGGPPAAHASHSTSHMESITDAEPKKGADITATRMPSQEWSAFSTEQPLSPKNGRPWETTLLRWGPLGGLACMIVAVGSIIVSLGVLLGSDGAPVANWGAEPSAILAICTAVANQALRFAAFQGFVVSWWANASRGISLRNLHSSWRAGTTFLGALVAGRNMGLIGLACIVSTLLAIDGPFLQKATTVVNAPITNHPVDLKVSMSPEIPQGYTGGWVRNDKVPHIAATEFNRTVPTAKGSVRNDIIPFFRTDAASAFYTKKWFQDEIISGVIQGCNGVCKATVTAPALAETTCRTRQIPVNYTVPTGPFGLNYDPPLKSYGFLITGEFLVDGHEGIDLVTAYSTVEDCIGTLHLSICTLESAIGEYEVTVNNDKITLAEAPPRIVALANNTRVNHTWDEEMSWYPSTLAGITSLLFVRWESFVAWYKNQGTIRGTTNGLGPPEIYGQPGKGHCEVFNDPKEDLLLSVNQLMFNIGAVAARENASYLQSHLDPGLPQANRTITGHLHGDHNIFRTNLRWFAAAAAVEAVCIALILPTYIGFWRLGRQVSFSPLEIAKAFEAPLFSDCNSNSSGNDIAKAVGGTPVQYGVTRSAQSGGTQLAFASPSIVEHPMKGARFDV